MRMPKLFFLPVLLIGLAGCIVGLAFVAPQAEASPEWSAWYGGDAALQPNVLPDAVLPERWWAVFRDPVLDRLLAQAQDCQSRPEDGRAALRAGARFAPGPGCAAGPQHGANGGVARQRQSEQGAATRMLDVIGSVGGGSASSMNRDQLAQLLASPFTLYQAGFDGLVGA